MKNISFVERKNLWCVRFERHKSYKCYYFDTLEEAKIYREKVKAFIKEHDRLPSREELGLRGRKAVVYKSLRRNRAKIFDVECSRCGAKHQYRKRLYFDNFERRGRLCKSCSTTDVIRMICERDEPNETNQLGIRNISIDTRSHKYRVDIFRNGKRSHATYETLQEALAAKSKILDYFKEHGELPSSSEIESFV